MECDSLLFVILLCMSTPKGMQNTLFAHQSSKRAIIGTDKIESALCFADEDEAREAGIMLLTTHSNVQGFRTIPASTACEHI